MPVELYQTVNINFVWRHASSGKGIGASFPSLRCASWMYGWQDGNCLENTIFYKHQYPSRTIHDVAQNSNSACEVALIRSLAIQFGAESACSISQHSHSFEVGETAA